MSQQSEVVVLLQSITVFFFSPFPEFSQMLTGLREPLESTETYIELEGFGVHP